MTDLDAFILIGGRSSRFGSDKSRAMFDGKTLAERAVDSVRNGLPSSRITAVARSSTQTAIEAIALDVPFIFDLIEDRGPLGGLHAALANAKSSWIFLLACDYPFVTGDLISGLAGMISDRFGSIVPIQSDGRPQPLCAFYDVSVARPIVDAILTGPRVPPPMYEVVEQLQPRLVRYNEYRHLLRQDDPFVNVNTVQDLRLATKIVENG